VEEVRERETEGVKRESRWDKPGPGIRNGVIAEGSAITWSLLNPEPGTQEGAKKNNRRAGIARKEKKDGEPSGEEKSLPFKYERGWYNTGGRKKRSGGILGSSVGGSGARGVKDEGKRRRVLLTQEVGGMGVCRT